jgi:metabolite-proton symporter
MRRVVAASFFGTAMETYDLYLYGTASAMIFSHLYFPNFDPGVALLLSMSTFAVSFVARPLGAVVFGHFGDRVGRKNTLYITLLMMGLATVAVGLLPTYETIGFAAPAILVVLRFLQGFGFGGEYSGAVLMITEHAPPEKRGFYAGLNNIGPAVGFISSTGIILVTTAVMSEDSFLAWGWRVPFLLSAILVGVGLYLRRSIAESPVFTQAAKQSGDVRKPAPLVGVFRHYPRELLLSSGAMMLIFAMFYLFSVHSLSYGTEVLGLDRTVLLVLVIIAMVVNGLAIPVFSALSDRIGRRATCLLGTLLAAAWAFPYYWLFDSANPVLIGLAFCVQMALYGMIYGPVAAYAGELFGAGVRYTGMAISYNVAGILGAAPAPLIATVLLDSTGGSWSISLYVVVLAAISFLCLLALPETRSRDLAEDRTAMQPAPQQRR